jgi:hypothetical protein
MKMKKALIIADSLERYFGEQQIDDKSFKSDIRSGYLARIG